SCGTPAFLKYLLTMMSVASWLQVSGTSASFISKTTDPSGFEILEDRLTHFTEEKGFWPTVVNLREIFIRYPSLDSSCRGRGRHQATRHQGIKCSASQTLDQTCQYAFRFFERRLHLL